MSSSASAIIGACRIAMAVACLAVASGVPAAQKPAPPDWTAFDDPTTHLFTDGFAESINRLPAADKAAAVNRS